MYEIGLVCGTELAPQAAQILKTIYFLLARWNLLLEKTTDTCPLHGHLLLFCFFINQLRALKERREHHHNDYQLDKANGPLLLIRTHSYAMRVIIPKLH